MGVIDKYFCKGKIQIGMDIAASEFFKNGKYDLDFKNPESKEADWITSDQLIEMYKGFIKVAIFISEIFIVVKIKDCYAV